MKVYHATQQWHLHLPTIVSTCHATSEGWYSNRSMLTGAVFAAANAELINIYQMSGNRLAIDTAEKDSAFFLFHNEISLLCYPLMSLVAILECKKLVLLFTVSNKLLLAQQVMLTILQGFWKKTRGSSKEGPINGPDYQRVLATRTMSLSGSIISSRAKINWSSQLNPKCLGRRKVMIFQNLPTLKGLNIKSPSKIILSTSLDIHLNEFERKFYN